MAASQPAIELFFRTEEMSMVTYLKLCGHQVQKVEWDGGSCYWTFDRSDLLESAVDEFISGEARVEPREYNRQYAKVKDQMFAAAPPGKGRRQRQ